MFRGAGDSVDPDAVLPLVGLLIAGAALAWVTFAFFTV